MEKEQKRAALYCRVANAGLLDTNAIDTQLNALRAFAEQQGFKDCPEYLDNGYNGLTLDRPAFARMDADIKAGKIDTVIVRSIDRVARDYLIASKWIGELEARGVRLIAADGSHAIPNIIEDALYEFMRNMRHTKSKKL